MASDRVCNTAVDPKIVEIVGIQYNLYFCDRRSTNNDNNNNNEAPPPQPNPPQNNPPQNNPPNNPPEPQVDQDP